MSEWLKVFVIGGVTAVWIVYVISQIIKGQDIPVIVWTVPGATVALLTDKIQSIRLKRGEPPEITLRKEDDE